ncbi:hypothetical protein E3J38_09510 [candidate division TA06 bacterium]|uniref:Uncharacterized protein n=1 Tax=candidate division TA06 bacterium TaxID=2250710 RepID=A0A523XEN5_UNCT6|nr:MAG: hypothetical protein E3J38_09510 [candidate division TA06 bacterium]
MLLVFRKERDWEQFHTPKNLAVSISIEAGELLEHFQWITGKDTLSSKKKKEAAKKSHLGTVHDNLTFPMPYCSS